MALQARRFHGKPLLQPDYNFRDVPRCSPDLSGSTLSVVTDRQDLVNSIAEFTLLCNEATRRNAANNGNGNGNGKGNSSSSSSSSKAPTKPLSIEYIFDRIDTDDPIWGLMVRTDTPTTLKGRPVSNSNGGGASSPPSSSSSLWKRGMLQGFITMTTFTNWQSSFKFDSMHEMAFGQDDDDLERQMRDGNRRYDESGTLADELERTVKGGDPHVEGIVYPRIAEVSLFGALGCGKQLLRLLIEHLERLKPTVLANYDYIVLQATENSIPFYESMGLVRVGCVQGRGASPDNGYHSGPVEEYRTSRNGETPASVAAEHGADAWDVVFLNRPMYPGLVQKSWLKAGTKVFVPGGRVRKGDGDGNGGEGCGGGGQKWYMARENDTPRGIARRFGADFGDFLRANKRRYPGLVANSKLMEGTRIQVSRFDFDEGDMVAYAHWTFPDAEAGGEDGDEPSYMMAMRLDRNGRSRRGADARARPVADSLAAPMRPYSPEGTGAADRLLRPKPARAPVDPIFAKRQTPREPKKPKRPSSSYAIFTSEARASMAGELRGMTIVEVNGVLSEKWRALSDDEKRPYQERFEESRAAYNKAMKKYEADMERFRSGSEANHDDHDQGEIDTSLLEKVVKLKSTEGISGTSKFEYYYVLTFIPDLQWVHLIPMRKAGVFGPEYPDACGRTIWMVEDEGKEIDTHASACQPVTAFTMKHSEDADDEEWDVYDNGEKVPPSRLATAVTSPLKVVAKSVPGAPVRPKKPATSFAYFCREANSSMKDQLENKLITERTKIIAEVWREMTDEQKKKYQDRRARAHEKYSKELEQYKEDLAKFLCDNPGADAPVESFKTPKHSKAKTPVTGDRGKFSPVSSKTPKSSKAKTPPTENGGSQKRKRGRPRKHPLPDPNPSKETPDSKRGDASPTPNRKRERPSKTPISPTDSSSADAVHPVKKDPAALEQLLQSLKGDHSATNKRAPLDKPGKTEVIHVEQGDDDVVLSLLHDKYRNIMWEYFKKLGKKQQGGSVEEAASKEVFQSLKMGLKGGRFLKKSPHGPELFEVDKDVALHKIFQDLKRRMDSSQRWLVDHVQCASPTVDGRPQQTPTRSKRRECQQISSVEERPTLAPSRLPSRYSRRGPRPGAIEEDSKKRSASTRQLAPIFLKKYGKRKNKQAGPADVQEPNKDSTTRSRYPERKRKQIVTENVVSDDAVSDTSVGIFEPTRKRAKAGL